MPYRADVTEPDPNIISKYLSEPGPARWVPLGIVGYHWVPLGTVGYHWARVGYPSYLRLLYINNNGWLL